MLAYKQPKNLLHQLTKAAFTSTPQQNIDRNEYSNNEIGLFKCGSEKMKVFYLIYQYFYQLKMVKLISGYPYKIVMWSNYILITKKMHGY